MVNIKMGFIFKCIISSLIMGTLIMFLDPWNIVEIMATVICSVCIYFGILSLLNGFSRDEFVFFKKIFGI